MSCPNFGCQFVRLVNRSADRSQSSRIDRLKNKANAAFYSSEGIAGFTISRTSSVVLSIHSGQRDITTRDHYANETVTDPGCCGSAGQAQPGLLLESPQAPPTNVIAVPGADAGTIDVSWTGDDSAYLVSAGGQFVIGSSPVTLLDLVAGTYTITVTAGSQTATTTLTI